MESIAGPSVFFMLVLAFGFFTFFRGFLDYREARRIADTPRSKCRSVAMGLVEVSGTAAGDETTPSLITQIPCYCSRVYVEQYSETRNSRGWIKLSEQEVKFPFYVEDETGRAKVAPGDAELTLAADVEYDTSLGPTLLTPNTLLRLQQAHRSAEELPLLFGEYHSGTGSEHGLFRERMRFRESNLCPGDPVFVLGTATEVSTQIGAGQDRILIRQVDEGRPFMIAESSPREFLSRTKTRAVLRIAGGGLLALFAIGVLITLFA